MDKIERSVTKKGNLTISVLRRQDRGEVENGYGYSKIASVAKVTPEDGAGKGGGERGPFGLLFLLSARRSC